MKIVFITLLVGFIPGILFGSNIPEWISTTPEIPFDEVFDQDNQLRDHYQKFFNISSQLSEQVKDNKSIEHSFYEFRKNIYQGLPRILDKEENDHLRLGSIQLTKALQNFLIDLAGKRKILDDGIVPTLTLNRILKRNGIDSIDFFKNKSFNFSIGIDLLRDADGSFVINEINVYPLIGGIDGFAISQLAFLNEFSHFRSKLDTHEINNYFESLYSCYDKNSTRFEGVPVRVSRTKTYQNIVENRDKEDLECLLDNFDIPTFRQSGTLSNHGTVLDSIGGEIVENKGFYFNGKKIGHLINFCRPDAVNPEIIKLVEQGNLSISFTPGSEFLMDKEFYIYLEDIIKYYLHEDPLFGFAQTEPFVDDNNRSRLDLIETVMENLPNVVIKSVDSIFGRGVWIGPYLSEVEKTDLRNEMIKNPDVFIVQRLIPISQMGNRIVDLRICVDSINSEILVTPIPWGRSNANDSDGKTNISQKGSITPVIISSQFITDKSDFEHGSLTIFSKLDELPNGQ